MVKKIKDFDGSWTIWLGKRMKFVQLTFKSQSFLTDKFRWDFILWYNVFPAWSVEECLGVSLYISSTLYCTPVWATAVRRSTWRQKNEVPGGRSIRRQKSTRGQKYLRQKLVEIQCLRIDSVKNGRLLQRSDQYCAMVVSEIELEWCINKRLRAFPTLLRSSFTTYLLWKMWGILKNVDKSIIVYATRKEINQLLRNQASQKEKRDYKI